MNTRSIFTTLLIALFFSACFAPTSYKVTGDLSEFLSSYEKGSTIDSVYITYKDCAKEEKVPVAPDGSFTLTGSIETPTEAYLIAEFSVPGGKGESSLLFVLEHGKITINDLTKGDIQGTPLNDAVYGEITYLQQTNDSIEQKQKRLSAFLEKYKQTPAPSVLLYSIIRLNLLSAEESLAIIEQADPSIRNNSVIDAYASSLKRELKRKKLASKITKGSMFTDFEVEYKGKVQRLSDYVGRGKYVLVDFWASWCAPCRQEIPSLIELYEQYKDKGLVVLGVTVNDKPENTEEAIKTLGIPYPQIMNGGNTAVNVYGISSIPYIILFGPDGTILKSGMRGKAIKQAIDEVLD